MVWYNETPPRDLHDYVKLTTFSHLHFDVENKNNLIKSWGMKQQRPLEFTTTSKNSWARTDLHRYKHWFWGAWWFHVGRQEAPSKKRNVIKRRKHDWNVSKLLHSLPWQPLTTINSWGNVLAFMRQAWWQETIPLFRNYLSNVIHSAKRDWKRPRGGSSIKIIPTYLWNDGDLSWTVMSSWHVTKKARAYAAHSAKALRSYTKLSFQCKLQWQQLMPETSDVTWNNASSSPGYSKGFNVRSHLDRGHQLMLNYWRLIGVQHRRLQLIECTKRQRQCHGNWSKLWNFQ